MQIFNLGHTHTHIERVKSECITLLSWGGGLPSQLPYGRAVHCTELYVSLVCCSWILNNLGTRPMNNRTNDKDKTSWDHQSTTTSADCNNLIFSLGTLGRLLCAVSQYQCIPSNQQDDEKGRSRVFTLCINNADSMRTSEDGASSAYTKCTKKTTLLLLLYGVIMEWQQDASQIRLVAHSLPFASLLNSYIPARTYYDNLFDFLRSKQKYISF